jgi:uncharacterized protein YceK
VLSLAENSSQNIKRKVKTDPRLLFAKYNCEIIKQTEDFLIVVPLDWECAVFFNSFACGGKGARWCIGDSDNASHWNDYLAGKNVFLLVFFVNEHPVYKRKAVIQYHIEDGAYALWLQDNTESNQIFSPLDAAIELIKNSAKLFLSRICHKDYILKGSVLTECYDLKSINIPDSVTAIGSLAFFGCENLSSIIVEKQNPYFSSIDSVLFDKIENRILCYPAGKQDACYTVPAGVAAIEGDAFSGCKNLAVIDIPDSVTAIGYNAFSGCKRLRSITVGKQNQSFSSIDGVLFDKIVNELLHYPAGKQDACYIIPDGVDIIGHGAFSDCKNLRSIIVGKQSQSFSSIDGVLFDKFELRILRYPSGKQDAYYTIPDGVITIGGHAFSGCENIVNIDISDGITAIKYSAFSGCKNLVAIDIPDSVTTIGNFAFFDCENLKAVYLFRKIAVSEYAFDGTKTKIIYKD